jgi:hypothetical protein
LDNIDEALLRGIELNAAMLDQAEEMDEGIIDTLDTRIGRWDQAYPPKAQQANWPKDDFNRFIVPSYLFMTCNPEYEEHFLWDQYHPDSPKHWEFFQDRDYFEVSAEDNPFLSPETLKIMKSRDPQWVKRFVYGQWGISEATVHNLLSDSVIDPSQEWLENFLKKAKLFRSFDHGETAPTCCLWWAAFENIFLCYREYYMPNKIISYHRKEVNALSGFENYVVSIADPSIFHIKPKAQGGVWSIAKEYCDPSFDEEPINFIPGDNNEFATRNRINELLRLHEDVKHPITGESPAPQIYFIKQSENHPHGCVQAISEIRKQSRNKIGTINGKDIYSEDRKDNIPDHAYDAVRYFVAFHGSNPAPIYAEPSPNSFLGLRAQKELIKVRQMYNHYGDLAFK